MLVADCRAARQGPAMAAGCGGSGGLGLGMCGAGGGVRGVALHGDVLKARRATAEIGSDRHVCVAFCVHRGDVVVLELLVAHTSCSKASVCLKLGVSRRQ
mmetsp:Transcript_74599/g.140646  ORF Transcript_74599/g.140646 Transcript_74599/m.140646 type:complete len:100 (-) Transcript_74599:132-431(-)